MKRVPFNIAKALKDAGYPQKGISYYWYSKEGTECYSESDLDEIGYIFAPFVMEAWLWLWREKGTPIRVDYAFCGIDDQINDPEEAIEGAIAHLVANKLLR